MTHGNAATPATTALGVLLPYSDGGREVFLSFLPLAHIFERGNMVIAFARGWSVGIYHGVITEVC